MGFKTKATGGALVLGAAGTLAYNVLILPWEGNKLKPYLDVGNVPTACGGVTGPEITAAYNAGVVFTKEQCDVLNKNAVAKHEKALRDAIHDNVEKTVPLESMAAFISWTFNVGPNAVKKSTLVRHLNNGNILEACKQLSRWTYVNGIVIRGLENRRTHGDEWRISERDLCFKGIGEKPKSNWFYKIWSRLENV